MNGIINIIGTRSEKACFCLAEFAVVLIMILLRPFSRE
jgi:hypothetical protein